MGNRTPFAGVLVRHRGGSKGQSGARVCICMDVCMYMEIGRGVALQTDGEEQTGMQTDRRADGQANGQTGLADMADRDGRRDRQTGGRQTDRQTDSHTESRQGRLAGCDAAGLGGGPWRLLQVSYADRV